MAEAPAAAPAPVPGAWLDLDRHNGLAAKRLRESSEVLKELGALKVELRDAGKRKPWVKTQSADLFFAAVIVAYALLVGGEVELRVRRVALSETAEYGLLAAQGVFVLAFCIELCLRLCADGLRYVSPCNPAGFFDGVIILAGLAEFVISVMASPGSGDYGGALIAAGPMRLIRLLRLMRLMRILLVCRELRMLLIGLVSSISTVSWAFVLLMIMMYLGTLFCVTLLGKEPALQQYFGSVGIGFFTHFQIVTLEAWPDISDDTMAAAGPQWALYFVLFICTTSLALMNLVTGVVCEKLLSVKPSEEDVNDPVEAYEALQRDFKAKTLGIFRNCDCDKSGTADREEFRVMLQNADMQQLMSSMEISDDLGADDLFEILDQTGKGSLTFNELADAMLRLRGSKQRLHSMMLQRDFVQCNRRQAQKLHDLDERFSKQAKRDLREMELSLHAEIDALEAAAVGGACAAAAATSVGGGWPLRARRRRSTAPSGGEEEEQPPPGAADSMCSQLGEKAALWRENASQLQRVLADLGSTRDEALALAGRGRQKPPSAKDADCPLVEERPGGCNAASFTFGFVDDCVADTQEMSAQEDLGVAQNRGPCWRRSDGGDGLCQRAGACPLGRATADAEPTSRSPVPLPMTTGLPGGGPWCFP